MSKNKIIIGVGDHPGTLRVLTVFSTFVNIGLSIIVRGQQFSIICITIWANMKSYATFDTDTHIAKFALFAHEFHMLVILVVCAPPGHASPRI